MNKLVILLIFCFIPKSYACICDTFWTEWNESQTAEFVTRTDVIFIGELKSLSLEEGCYEFEILEVFKGKVDIGSLVTGHYITSCSAMPALFGDYLIYGDYDNFGGQTKLDYSQCGPSKRISDFKRTQDSEYFKKELRFLNHYSEKRVRIEE